MSGTNARDLVKRLSNYEDSDCLEAAVLIENLLNDGVHFLHVAVLLCNLRKGDEVIYDPVAREVVGLDAAMFRAAARFGALLNVTFERPGSAEAKGVCGG